MSLPRIIRVHEEREKDDTYLVASLNMEEAMAGLRHHERRLVGTYRLIGKRQLVNTVKVVKEVKVR